MLLATRCSLLTDLTLVHGGECEEQGLPKRISTYSCPIVTQLFSIFMVEEDASSCAYGIEITSTPGKSSGVVYGARDARHFQDWVPLSDHAVLVRKRPLYNDVGCY